MPDKIAVLIPCYNESKTVAKVIRDMRKALPESVIYVYDNNSTDGTDEIARKEGAVVRYEYQQGKGNVIRSMFRDIDAQCYLMVDGDDTYPAEFAAQMCEKVLKNGTDMVVGDRLSSTYFTENKRPFHNFGNSIVRGSINRLFKSDIKDIMTGYRAMSYRFVKTFPVLSRNFEIETEMTIYYSSGAVCSRDGIFYSGTDPLSGSGNCEQTAYTDRKWICDHDSDYLLVFRNYPVYTGQSAQAGF